MNRFLKLNKNQDSTGLFNSRAKFRTALQQHDKHREIKNKKNSRKVGYLSVNNWSSIENLHRRRFVSVNTMYRDVTAIDIAQMRHKRRLQCSCHSQASSPTTIVIAIPENASLFSKSRYCWLAALFIWLFFSGHGKTQSNEQRRENIYMHNSNRRNCTRKELLLVSFTYFRHVLNKFKLIFLPLLFLSRGRDFFRDLFATFIFFLIYRGFMHVAL